jgi:hypothetical protein
MDLGLQAKDAVCQTMHACFQFRVPNVVALVHSLLRVCENNDSPFD